jgi:hypothetical protein
MEKIGAQVALSEDEYMSIWERYLAALAPETSKKLEEVALQVRQRGYSHKVLVETLQINVEAYRTKSSPTSQAANGIESSNQPSNSDSSVTSQSQSEMERTNASAELSDSHNPLAKHVITKIPSVIKPSLTESPEHIQNSPPSHNRSNKIMLVSL